MNRLKTFFIVVFIMISPWFISIMGQYQNINKTNFEVLNLGQYEIDEINTLRGELWNVSLNRSFSKLVINKYIFYFQELSKRYFETFDPHFLFFVGNKQFLLNTQSQGLLYFTYFILIAYLFFKSDYKNKKLLISLVFTMPLLGAFSETEFELITKVPFFMILSIAAAEGFNNLLFKKKYFIVYLIVFLLIFEFIKFGHYFYFIYPIDQIKYLSNFK